jgi:serine/threonine protein kinase/Tfp pilus assembly protein PilF
MNASGLGSPDPSAANLFDAWNPSESDRSASGATAPDSLELPVPGVSVLPPLSVTLAKPNRDGGADFILADPSSPALIRPLQPIVGPQLAPNVSPDTAVAELRSSPVVFPKLGEAIGGFRLVSELGRGAFARVYLAHEVALGNRPVALKVSKAEGDEPKILARLQHTHIVPIYSVIDVADTGLRLICMPYFGGANLAQVLDATGGRVHNQSQGQSLVDALDLVGLPAISQQPARCARRRGPAARDATGRGSLEEAGHTRAQSAHRSLLARVSWRPHSRRAESSDQVEVEETQLQPARQFLRESTFVCASAWIMARLAEGLDHAHSRGLLHRDLKPSNILIAADGTPMLLDFNLAADTIEDTPGDGVKAMMGGTLPYMSPEHLDAFNPRGTTLPEAVDERSDIYALGLILFEMTAGRPAFPEPEKGLDLTNMLAHLTAERRQGAPSLRAANPEVPWGLDAIVAKCLQPDPSRRYRSARELAEELRRFLDDLPFKYTREPSLRERVSRWARRHPRATSASTIGPLAVVLTLSIAGIAWTQAAHLREVAARLNLRRFRETFSECQFLLNTSSGGVLTDHLRRGIDRAQLAIDRFGVARGGDWERSYWVNSLAPDEKTELRSDLAELILLEARARVMLAEKEGTEGDRKRVLEWAVAWLDRAETFDPKPSPALFADRARYHAALGQAELARRDRGLRDSTEVASCRDEYLLGTADLAEGSYDRAEARLGRAVALDPNRFWAWFALGLSHIDQGRYTDAVGDFNVCTVLVPKFAWPYVNRGFALARAGRLAEAVASFDRAVGLDSRFADAFVGRGLAYLEMGRAEEAESDLSRAIELGRRDVNVRAGLAESRAKLGHRDQALTIYGNLIDERPDDARLRAARGMIRLETDPVGAEADLVAALGFDGNLALAHYGRARVRYLSDRSAALGHADRALQADPRFLDALQLRALIRAHLGLAGAVDDVDNLIQAPSPNRLYNAACAMAILSRTRPDPRHEARAIDLLRRALATGFPASTARDDGDFQALHANPVFRKLVGL